MKNWLTHCFVAFTTFAMSIELMKPKESLGFLAWKVARLTNNCLAARFAAEGIDITVEQWRALIPLYKVDGLTQGKLCNLMSQEKTGVSRLVAGLERRGLVRREAARDDRRVKNIYITDQGRRLMDVTIPMAIESRETCYPNIAPEDLAICMRVLWQIVEPTFDCDCMP
jgi:DNA-binding MarR family transcriptional regulator